MCGMIKIFWAQGPQKTAKKWIIKNKTKKANKKNKKGKENKLETTWAYHKVPRIFFSWWGMLEQKGWPIEKDLAQRWEAQCWVKMIDSHRRALDKVTMAGDKGLCELWWSSLYRGPLSQWKVSSSSSQVGVLWAPVQGTTDRTKESPQ